MISVRRRTLLAAAGMVGGGALMPASATLAASVFSVTDFGARGDGTTDDGAAVRAAIQAASRSGPGATVFFPAGRYVIGGDGTPGGEAARAHLLLAGVKGLTLAGQDGAVLLFNDPLRDGIACHDCTGVTLRGLAIDWHPLPFTQGTIVAVDPDRAEFGTFDWLLTGGFPSPLAPPLAELATRGIVFPSRRKGVDNVHYRDLDQLSEDTFRFHLHARGLSQHVRLLQDGDRFVPTIQGREQPAGNAIAFHSSVGCQLEQISIYTSPRAGVISSSSTGVETRQSVISPPAGSDRWVSIAPYHTRVLG